MRSPLRRRSRRSHHRHRRRRPSLAYRPRKGLELRDGKTRVRSFFAVETNASYGHCGGDGCPPDDISGLHVRRARAAFDVRLPHDLGIDFAIQVKNEIIVLKNAYLAWRPEHRLHLFAGFMKPPGGLERDTSTWIKPFPERSVVANFKRDRIIGVRAYSWNDAHTFRLRAALGRSPVGAFDAQEPEDQVPPPAGAELEDLAKAVGNFEAFGTAAFVPSDRFERGGGGVARRGSGTRTRGRRAV